jgi:acyl carrier protein
MVGRGLRHKQHQHTFEGGLTDMDNILAKVRAAFESAFHIDPHLVNIDTTPNDIPAWDSMGHVVLASSLEQAFSITLDVDELMEMENVRAIVRIIGAKLGIAGE